MVHSEELGQVERSYLRAVYLLTEREAKNPVSIRDIQEFLGFSHEEAERCCDFWTERGALAWAAALGHVTLTHVGLAQAEQLDDHSEPPTPGGPFDIPVESGSAPAEGVADSSAAVVSVVVPVLNEADTVGRLIRLLARSPRVLEVLAVDDGSIDGTPEISAEAGAVVLTSSLLGKGASMQDGLRAATGGVILFVDGDLLDVRDDLVALMTDPIFNGEADMVKACFTREAGRVTVLTARPLLNSFFPELARFGQPLGGIVAARRSLLENLRLEDEYGVDVALLIDAVMKGARVTEVDIGRIDHESQSLEALGEMAKEITRVILDRAWRHERLSINRVLERQESERRARAQYLPTPLATASTQPFALFDMDGVILDGRYVVELAGRVGVESDLTHLLDSKMLRDEERSSAIAALFSGVPMDLFMEVARSMPLVEGAVDTIVGLRRRGYRVGIVTDSYHIAAETVRRRVFADFCVAHVMHFRNAVSTGELTLAPTMLDRDGCPLHICCKSNFVRHLQATADLGPTRILAVGDGENDICMLRMAGTSVAFRANCEEVERAADHHLNASLTEILELLDSGRPSKPSSNSRHRPSPLGLGSSLVKQAG